MTQAFNLSQLANNVNTSGQLNAAAGLYNQVPVANGGTGLSTATGALVGAGATISAIAAGTAGNVLTSNGTTWTSAAATGGAATVTTIYTSPAPWTRSPTLKALKVTIVAGGGGGGGSNTAGPASAGGGGGNGGILYGYAQAPAIPGPVTVTVGTGGSGGGPSGNGTSGGTSSFGAIFSTTGGAGGVAGPTSSPTPGANGASGGSFAISSTATISSLQLTNPRVTNTNGILSGFGVTQTFNNPAPAGAGYGAGGSGTTLNTGTGGAGSTGFVIVEEFY